MAFKKKKKIVVQRRALVVEVYKKKSHLRIYPEEKIVFRKIQCILATSFTRMKHHSSTSLTID